MASHYRRWSKEEDAFLMDNYYLLGAKGIAFKLCRSANSVSNRYCKMYKKEMEKNASKTARASK